MDRSNAKGKDKKPRVSRRSWSDEEDRCLLNALKEFVATGGKSDNGFRPGYQTFLEDAMRTRFPGTDIKATPHIHSKLQVWKLDYKTLSGVINKSGVGFNDTENMITVESQEKWDSAVKCDPKAESFRFKKWPYYPDWIIIFGKDFATGEGHENVADVPPRVAIAPETSFDVEEFSTNADGTEENTNNPSMNDNDTGASGSKKSSGSRKRKSSGGDMQDIVHEIREFRQEAQSSLSEMVSKFGNFEFELSKKRTQVFGVLGNMGWLTMPQVVSVGKYIVDNSRVLEYFFSMTEQFQEEMVRQILEGKI